MVKGKGRRTLHLLLPGCSLGLEALVPSRLGVRLNVGNFGEFLIFSIVADTAALRAFLLGVSTLPGLPATTLAPFPHPEGADLLGCFELTLYILFNCEPSTAVMANLN